MPDTFESIWREVRLHSPSAPSELVQNWVRDRFRDLISRRLWSWAFGKAEFASKASVSTGTVTVSNASATVAGSGTAWTSAAVGMQFKCRNYVYTVSTVDVGGQTLTLDRAWTATSSSGTNYILVQAYFTVPSDFKAFHSVIDPENNWRLWCNYTSRELDAWDPARTSTGNPAVLASCTYSADATPLPRYEMWPHPVTQKGFTYIYWKISSDFGEGVSLPFNVRGDVIKKGALSDLCRYPGTPDAPNKMFNLQLAAYYEKLWETGVVDMERNDQEIYLTDLWYADSQLPYAPLDAKFYQTHAF